MLYIRMYIFDSNKRYILVFLNFEVGCMSYLASCKFATFCGAVKAAFGCFSYRGQTSQTDKYLRQLCFKTSVFLEVP